MGPPPLPPRPAALQVGERTHVDTQGRRDTETDQEDPLGARQRRQCCTWSFRCCCSDERTTDPEKIQARADARAKSLERAKEKFAPGSHLSQSVYIWACGKKADGQKDDLRTSDELIGFLILLLQALSYIVVIRRSGEIPETTSYSITSVTAAMYLLVQTASPDLRSGFSLLVDGASRRYFIFGACMLVVFGLLITAAMEVIFSSAENDAAVVSNAVTILFVADLDEKVLSFFLTVPPKWRLFWLTNIISISFSLALAGLLYVGNPGAVEDGGEQGTDGDEEGTVTDADDGSADNVDVGAVLQLLPTWYVFAVNPAAVTFLSFATSRLLSALCEIRTNGDQARREPWLRKVLRQGTSAIVNAVKTEPWFHATLCVWFGVSCRSWWAAAEGQGWDFPFAMTVSNYRSSSSMTASSYSEDPEVTGNIIELVAANLALASGLVMIAVRSASNRAQQPTSVEGPRRSSTGSTEPNHTSKRSRVPSLLVGWGAGYWLTSFLYLLGSSWSDGGWDKAPLAVSIFAYIALPLVFVIGIFVVADRDILGEDVQHMLEPVVDALQDDTSVLHWAVVTVLRDVTMVWGFIMYLAVPRLNVL